MSNKPSTTMSAIVEKIIQPSVKSEPEKAQIAIGDADPLYREIRIENKLTDHSGNEVRLQVGTEVEVTIKTEPEATVGHHCPQPDGRICA